MLRTDPLKPALATGVVLAVLLIASSRTASIADKTAAAAAESGAR
jgi:hypothetical protein